MRVNGRLTTARRVAWELHHDPLLPGARVRGCDAEPRCVRVDHLTLTHAHRRRLDRGASVDRAVRLDARARPGVWTLTVTTEAHRRVFRTVTADRDGAAIELARLAGRHGGTPSTLDALVTMHLDHLAEAGRSRNTLRRYRQLWRTWLSPCWPIPTPTT